MPGMTLEIKKESKQHGRFVEELSSRIRLSEKAQQGQRSKWLRADQMVSAYTPADSDTVKRRNLRENYGRPEYTTLILPYTYAMLMAAHTYYTSVFFARSPVHQFTARHGEPEMAVQALEAIIDYQTRQGGAMAPYYLWLYDAAKYGLGVLGTYWDEEMASYSVMTEQNGKRVYVTNDIQGYKGNRCYNVSPWDFLPDPRVPLHLFQKGEFAGVVRRISWNDLIRRKKQDYYMNIEHIRTAPTRKVTHDTGDWIEGPTAISDNVGSKDDSHPAWVEVYEMYVDLIPEDWKLGGSDMPEKWVFTITADLATIIGAQPLGAVHCRYPFDVMEVEPEAYSLYNRGIPEVLEPLQNTMDWLVNSHFYNVRATQNGRFIADPSRIDLTQLESDEPGWIAALLPEAWGTVTDIQQVFKQIQVSDPTANHLNDMERIYQFGERATGINDQILGALGGGRKTATEVRTTTSFGTNRLKTSTEYMSATGMSSHSQMLVQNTQQFMDQELEVKIAGSLLNMTDRKTIRVDPTAIRGFFDFVPVDGTLPVDRFAQATLWKDILGQMRSVPQVMQQFDMGKIFAWMATLAGVKNIDQFKIQVAGPEQLAQQAEAGNLIKFPGQGGPPGAPPQSGMMGPPPQAGGVM